MDAASPWMISSITATIFLLCSATALIAFDIAIGTRTKPDTSGSETGLRLAIAGCRKGRHGAAMESLFHHDDGGQFHILLVPVETGQL